MRAETVVLFLATVSAAQQARSPEPQSFTRPTPKFPAGSAAMHLEITNSSVRVFRVELAPHASTSIGRDVHDYMLLAVSGGTAEVVGPGNTFPVDLKSGEVEIFKGGWPHQLRSKSDAPTSWLVLELARELRPERALCGLSGPSCGQFRFGKTDKGEYNESILFETPSARLLRAELAPASTLPTHDDRRGHVVIPMASCNLTLNGSNAAHKAGESIWVQGAAELHNAGSETTRLVVLEIK